MGVIVCACQSVGRSVCVCVCVCVSNLYYGSTLTRAQHKGYFWYIYLCTKCVLAHLLFASLFSVLIPQSLFNIVCVMSLYCAIISYFARARWTGAHDRWWHGY
ncbi:MAG: hypothetical protein BYD32DRAFT_419888 [Podila humilis]|nr:MAG: hypothetical protein BYD32DRAFT_419888 [Podila humilis]